MNHHNDGPASLVLRLGSTLVTGATLLAVSAAPAVADTEGRVTRFEFSKVDRNWRMARVHRVLDTRGIGNGPPGGAYQIREYKPRSTDPFVRVLVEYEKRDGIYRVTSKWNNWD